MYRKSVHLTEILVKSAKKSSYKNKYQTFPVNFTKFFPCI